MKIINLMKTSNGNIVCSVVLALALASILKMSFNNSVQIIHGPPIVNVHERIFSFDDKCYNFNKIVSDCSNIKDNKLNI